MLVNFRVKNSQAMFLYSEIVSKVEFTISQNSYKTEISPETEGSCLAHMITQLFLKQREGDMNIHN